jgi:hypothetical protein
VDYLQHRTPDEITAFCRRLAAGIQRRAKGTSLAAEMLLHWLDGKGQKKVYSSDYFRGVALVESYLLREVRPVFLTQERAVLIGCRIWGGIVARLKGAMPPGGRPQLPDGTWPISYEGVSIEMPKTHIARLWRGMKTDQGEQDLFYALHGFGLTTEVIMSAKPLGGEKYEVRFNQWLTKAIDKYHWNSKRNIKIPNPDFGSGSRAAIAPTQPIITFYYRNAVRAEQAGLAHEFNSESTEWTPDDRRITEPTVIDISPFRVTKNGLTRHRFKAWLLK